MKEKLNHENPYRCGDSHELFDKIQKSQTVTKEECRRWMVEELGKSETAAAATVDTVLSPRRTSKRGDCRGRVSAEGHVYYMQKLARSIHFGIREPQYFRLRWRFEPLPRRQRRTQLIIVPQIKDKNKLTSVKEFDKKELVKIARLLKKQGMKMVKV